MKADFSKIGANVWLSIISISLIAVFVPLLVLQLGVLKFLPAGTITVVGEADTEISNQVASFTAGVYAVNDNRDTAINEVNTKIQAIIDGLKEFGVPEQNIMTQSLSVYQMEEPFDVDGRQRTTPGQWRVSNDVQVKLDDINRAGELADLLTRSGATNVYGPNFALENVDEVEVDLLTKAIEDARLKATSLANSQHRQVGEIVSVQEGMVQNSPFAFSAFKDMGLGGGGVPIEPGANQVSKSVTVTFRLK